MISKIWTGTCTLTGLTRHFVSQNFADDAERKCRGVNLCTILQRMDHFTVLHSTENSVFAITGIQAACNAVLLQLQRQMASVQGFTEALHHEVVILSRIRWKNKSWALRSMEPNPQSKRDLVFKHFIYFFFCRLCIQCYFRRVGRTLRVVVQYSSLFLAGGGQQLMRI